jgi:histidyl-tRNA synthetase
MTIKLYRKREDMQREIRRVLKHIVSTCNHMRDREVINPSDYLRDKLQEHDYGLDVNNRPVLEAIFKILNDAYGTTL